MARFVIGAALGDLGSPNTFLNPRSLEPVLATTISLRYEDAQGDGFQIHGTGFAYAGGEPVGGVVDALAVFSAAGDPLVTVTGLSTPLAQLAQVYAVVGLEAAFVLLAEGNDSFVGSRNGDILLAANGNDTVKGNAGDDYIWGGAGRDVLTGGAGADQFVFARGEGKDKITDFADASMARDDMIILSARQFNAMTVVETVTGVELRFGTRDVLTVMGWDAASVGADDFLLI